MDPNRRFQLFIKWVFNFVFAQASSPYLSSVYYLFSFSFQPPLYDKILCSRRQQQLASSSLSFVCSLSRTTSSTSWVVFILSFQLLNHNAPPRRRVIEWQSDGMSLWVAAVARFHHRWCQRTEKRWKRARESDWKKIHVSVYCREAKNEKSRNINSKIGWLNENERLKSDIDVDSKRNFSVIFTVRCDEARQKSNYFFFVIASKLTW